MKESENQEPSNMAGAAKGGNTSKEIVGPAVSAAVGEPVATAANDLRDASAILECEGYRMHAMALRQIAARLAAPTQVSASQALAEMEARKDAAYLERNQVVAALAKCFPSGVARTAIEGWSEDWHGCVYIDLPTGQVSWHFHDSQAYLFDGLPMYQGVWDGHDTMEKYCRVAALQVSAPQADYRHSQIEHALRAIVDADSGHALTDQLINVGSAALALPVAGAPQAGQEAQAGAAHEGRAVPEPMLVPKWAGEFHSYQN